MQQPVVQKLSPRGDRGGGCVQPSRKLPAEAPPEAAAEAAAPAAAAAAAAHKTTLHVSLS